MLRSKLGDSFDVFYSKFWQCRNAETSHGFKYYWEQLVSFPNAKLYLERYLYECRFSWARAFTTIEFTLGIQSTSFVESQNPCIKRVLESSNTSLCDLASIVTVFPAIESLVKRYLKSNVSHFLIEQMKESLFYTASRPTIEEIIWNRVQLKKSGNCKELQVVENNVTNIDITSESTECQFKWLQPFVNNELGETTNEVFINKMLFYRKVWGIARTAVNKCVLHRDHEFVSLIKDYLSRVRIRENELIEQQETSTHTSSNLEGTTLVNPRKVVGKGKSKAANYKNTTNIALQETSNKKKREQYTCGFCKETDHNIVTCPHKKD
ncbi:8026_t:CDS:2 [Gigaspora rosea]|nr:8026_t:CDS:2 [Gigaspora rosea]